MSTEIIKADDFKIIESLILNGDLSQMSPQDKVTYYKGFCERLGLDPFTGPFKILKLNGKEVLYADKGCAQQLSSKNGISHEILKKERIEDVFCVTVRASLPDGRYTDEDGAVSVGSAKGDNLANALMKAVTKAKRRAVLALMGLGMLDESEIETIPNAKTAPDPIKQAEIPEEPKVIVDYEKEFSSMTKRAQIDSYIKSLDKEEQTSAKPYAEKRKREIIKDNLEPFINTLKVTKGGDLEANRQTIEKIFDEMPQSDERARLIQVYNNKLIEIGLDETDQYAELIFGQVS